jgi:hypothetical protein
MNTIWWMAGGSAVCCLMALGVLGRGAGAEVLFGMIGPVIVAIVTFVAAERTWRRNPERLTALMATAFAAKMVFFAAYVAVMLKVLNLQPIPFVVSFASCFIALHLIEGLGLRRLFAGGPDEVRQAGAGRPW